MDRYDYALMTGIMLIAAGAYFVYPPLSLLVLGAGLIAVSLLGARGAR